MGLSGVADTIRAQLHTAVAIRFCSEQFCPVLLRPQHPLYQDPLYPESWRRIQGKGIRLILLKKTGTFTLLMNCAGGPTDAE